MPRPAPSSILLAAVRLLRPADALIAAADALAGMAVAWGLSIGDFRPGLWALPLAAFLIYAGGAALGEACDRDPESPERGILPRRAVLAVGAILLAAGVFEAALYSLATGLVATGLAVLIAGHAACLKHLPQLGAAVRGLCRAGSLLLGMAVHTGALARGWPLAFIPLAYVLAISLISRGDADGRPAFGLAALSLVALVVGSYGFMAATLDQWPALAFVVLFAAMVWPAFVRAAVAPSPLSIGNAMKVGALSLVAGDAVLAAVFGGMLSGLAILLLLPLAEGLTRLCPAA